MEQLGAPSKCLWSCQGDCDCSLCPLHEQAGICEDLLWFDPHRTFLGPGDACYPSQCQLEPFDPACSPRRTSCDQARRGKGAGLAPERIMVICQADPSFKKLQGWTDCVCTDCRLSCATFWLDFEKDKSSKNIPFIFTQKDGTLILVFFFLSGCKKSVCLLACQSVKTTFIQKLQVNSQRNSKQHIE